MKKTARQPKKPWMMERLMEARSLWTMLSPRERAAEGVVSEAEVVLEDEVADGVVSVAEEAVEEAASGEDEEEGVVASEEGEAVGVI